MATITTAQALSSLEPNAIWTIKHTGGGDVITWNSEDITQPNQSAIDTEIARLQVIEDANAYARNREAEYPTWQDQLDDIFHNGIDGWKATIQVTKDKYPKE